MMASRATRTLNLHRTLATATAQPPAPIASTSQQPIARRPKYRSLPTDPVTGLPVTKVEAPKEMRVVSDRKTPWTAVAADVIHRGVVATCILVSVVGSSRTPSRLTNAAIYDSVMGIRARRKRISQEIVDASAEDEADRTAKMAQANEAASQSRSMRI